MISCIFKAIASLLLLLLSNVFLSSCGSNSQTTEPSVVQNQYDSSPSKSKRQRPIYNKIILNKIQNSDGKTISNKKYSIVNTENDQNQTDDTVYMQKKLNKIDNGEIKIANRQDEATIEEKKLPKTIISSTDENKLEDKIENKITTTEQESAEIQDQKSLQTDTNQIASDQQEQILKNKQEENQENQDEYSIKPKNVFNDNSNIESGQSQTHPSILINAENEKKLETNKNNKQDAKFSNNKIRKNDANNKKKSKKNIIANLKSLDNNEEIKPSSNQTSQLNTNDEIIIDEDTQKALQSKFSVSNKDSANGIDDGGIIIDSGTQSAIEKISSEKTNTPKDVPIGGIIANRVANANARMVKKSVSQMQEEEIKSLRQSVQYKVMTEQETESGTYSVQIGSYETQEELIEKANLVSKITDIFIQPVVVGGKNYYRIKTLPSSSKKDADKTLYKLIKNGYYDIFITQNR